MVSIEKWKEHFKHMAQKGHMHEDDIFILNQSGHGLRRNAYPKCTLYKVRKTIGNTPVAIVSSVVGNIDKAKALMQKGGGGGKRKKKTYKKKKTKAKTVTKKKATKKKTSTTKTKKKKGGKKKKTTYISKCVKK